jgi:hypothetical protein
MSACRNPNCIGMVTVYVQQFSPQVLDTLAKHHPTMPIIPVTGKVPCPHCCGQPLHDAGVNRIRRSFMSPWERDQFDAGLY